MSTTLSYQDAPQPIGNGQTISAPHMHAYVLEEMLPYLKQKQQQQPHHPLRILDVGCGSGYLTACLGRFVADLDDDSTVTGVDIHASLVQRAITNTQKGDRDVLDAGRIHYQVANGWEKTFGTNQNEQQQWDAIHVGAAASPDIPPALLEQLSEDGGMLLIPVGPPHETQTLEKVIRYGPQQFVRTPLLSVRYVPLVRNNVQP